jgi:hypothetical protein
MACLACVAVATRGSIQSTGLDSLSLWLGILERWLRAERHHPRQRRRARPASECLSALYGIAPFFRWSSPTAPA